VGVEPVAQWLRRATDAAIEEHNIKSTRRPLRKSMANRWFAGPDRRF